MMSTGYVISQINGFVLPVKVVSDDGYGYMVEPIAGGGPLDRWFVPLGQLFLDKDEAREVAKPRRKEWGKDDPD